MIENIAQILGFRKIYKPLLSIDTMLGKIIIRKEAPMSLKDFLKTDHVDLNKSPMFRQLIKNLKKKHRKDS